MEFSFHRAQEAETMMKLERRLYIFQSFHPRGEVCTPEIFQVSQRTHILSCTHLSESFFFSPGLNLIPDPSPLSFLSAAKLAFPYFPSEYQLCPNPSMPLSCLYSLFFFLFFPAVSSLCALGHRWQRGPSSSSLAHLCFLLNASCCLWPWKRA